MGNFIAQHDRSLCREFNGIGKQVADNLSDSDRISFHKKIFGLILLVYHKLQTFRICHGLEAEIDFVKKRGYIKRNNIEFHLIGLEAMEIQQVVNQCQYMPRRSIHIIQIVSLSPIGMEPLQQFGISNNRR